MLIYFIGPISLLLLDKLHETSTRLEKKGLEYLVISFSAFILCTGYMTGSDWRGYELLYNDISISNLSTVSREWLFYLYMLSFKFIGVQFFHFLIFTKAIIFIDTIRVLTKYSKNDLFSVFFFLAYSVFGLFLFVDNPLRFMIALGIAMHAFDHIIKRQPIRFIITVLIAFLFHITAIVIIPAYFVKQIRLSKFKIILFYSLFYFLFSTSMLLTILEVLYKYWPNTINMLFRTYILKAQLETMTTLSIGLVFHYFLFLIIVLNKDNIENSLYGKYLFAFAIIYFILFKIGLIFPTAFRLALYFIPFFIASLCIIFKSSFLSSYYIKPVVVLYLLFSLYDNVYNSWTYYPYSNYFVALISGEKDFSYRSEYNKAKYQDRFNGYPEDEIILNADEIFITN